MIGEVVSGLEHAIVTMKKGETALFTLPPELGYGVAGRHGVVQPNSVVQFEVELVSWITVVDVSRDGGIIKKIMDKGESNEQPGDLDQVLGTLNCLVILWYNFVRNVWIVSMSSFLLVMHCSEVSRCAR